LSVNSNCGVKTQSPEIERVPSAIQRFNQKNHEDVAGRLSSFFAKKEKKEKNLNTSPEASSPSRGSQKKEREFVVKLHRTYSSLTQEAEHEFFLVQNHPSDDCIASTR